MKDRRRLETSKREKVLSRRRKLSSIELRARNEKKNSLKIEIEKSVREIEKCDSSQRKNVREKREKTFSNSAPRSTRFEAFSECKLKINIYNWNEFWWIIVSRLDSIWTRKRSHPSNLSPPLSPRRPFTQSIQLSIELLQLIFHSARRRCEVENRIKGPLKWKVPRKINFRSLSESKFRVSRIECVVESE